MSKVYRFIVHVGRDGVDAHVWSYDKVIVDGVPYAMVLDRLEQVRASPGEWHDTREAALRACASKLTDISSDALRKAEQMREEAAGV